MFRESREGPWELSVRDAKVSTESITPFHEFSRERYLRAAKHIESLGPQECHTAFWPRRCEIARRLREAANDPDAPHHRELLTALRLVVYTPSPL